MCRDYYVLTGLEAEVRDRPLIGTVRSALTVNHGAEAGTIRLRLK